MVGCIIRMAVFGLGIGSTDQNKASVRLHEFFSFPNFFGP